MIKYPQNIKRKTFVDKNNKTYTRFKDDRGNVGFIEVYGSLKDLLNACKEYPFDQKTIDSLKKYDPRLGYSIPLNSLIIMNVELLKIKESIIYLDLENRITDKEIMKQLNDFFAETEKITDDYTKVWAENCSMFPTIPDKYRPELFSIPNVVDRIYSGDDVFKDKNGTIVETSNKTAFKDENIRYMMRGGNTFDPITLSRIDNGLAKNKELEQEYNNNLSFNEKSISL